MKNVNISRALSSTRPRRRLQRAACAVAQNARSAQAASCQPAGNAAARLIQVPTNPTISTQMINISGSRNPLATACRNIFFLVYSIVIYLFQHWQRRRRRTWTSHVIRRIDNSWGQKSFQVTTTNRKRRIGRPSTRWTDDIVRVEGNRWMQMASCCTLRRYKDEVFVQHWTSSGSLLLIFIYT